VPAEIAALSTHVFEHERLPFVSYPSEWSPLMLCDAALLTLEMQKLALGAGLILKDAAPTNIVFRGSRPVFVDFLSFVERERGEYLWRARHQFDACFLLPLLLSIEAGVPIAWMLRDFLHGVSHEQAQRMLGVKSWLKPGLIGAVALPAALSRRVSAVGSTHAARRKMDSDERARFTLEHQAESLHRKLMKLRSRLISGVSLWGNYTSPAVTMPRPSSMPSGRSCAKHSPVRPPRGARSRRQHRRVQRTGRGGRARQGGRHR
jgi:hypothetical protein